MLAARSAELKSLLEAYQLTREFGPVAFALPNRQDNFGRLVFLNSPLNTYLGNDLKVPNSIFETHW